MSLRFRTLTGAGAVALGVCAGAMADNPKIEDVAPRDAYLVLSIPSWPAAKTAFSASPVGKLWEDRSMQDWLEKVWKQVREESSEEENALLEEFWERMQEIGEPAGAVGAAWSLAKAERAAGGEDEESAFVSTMYVIADFGTQAEKAEAAIVEFLEAQAESGRLVLTPVKVGGVDGHEIELKVEEEEEGGDVDADDDAAGDDEDFGMDEFEGMGDGPDLRNLLGGGAEGPVKLLLARSGGTLVVTSKKEGMEHALDCLSGAKRPHLGESPDWDATLAQHPRGGHFFGALFVNDSVREFLGNAGGAVSDVMPMPIDDLGLEFDKVMDVLGMAPMRAVSIGARLDAQVGGLTAIEQTVGVLLPEKKGLFTLIEGEATPFDPPAWIGADTASVSRFMVRFERIVPLAEAIVKTLPPDLQNVAEGGVQFAKTQFGPALAAMGPEVYRVGMIARPLSAASESGAAMIKVRDELAVGNTLAAIGAQAGMDARDFQGAQIYDAPDGTALGLGFGWLFIGDQVGVENAMRRAANPGEAGPSLAESERFRRATAAAGAAGAGLLQGWSDDQAAIDYAMWTAKNPDALMRKFWEGQGLDAGEIDDIMEGVDNEVPGWVRDMPPAELFKRYLDCSAFTFRSTPDGFRGVFLTVPPRTP